MNKILLFGLMLCLLILTGCRNFYDWSAEYDKEGNILKSSGMAYESKFTRKSVNIISEVQAIKLVINDPTTASMLPQLILGWGSLAFLEKDILPGERLVYYKETTSMFGHAVTGKTMLYIDNQTENNVNIESKPILLIDLPFLKVGMPPQRTVVYIGDKENPPDILGITEGDAEIKIQHKEE